MTGIVIILAALVLMVLWVVSVRRSLAAMDKNIGSAMNQIGVQLSSCFEELTALLDRTKDCAAQESRTLIESIRSRRSVITARSSAEKAREQEELITRTLGRVPAMVEAYPQLKMDESCLRYLSAAENYSKMVRTSRLIYNDSVTRLNRAIRTFPTSLAAGLLGFHQREYLVAADEMTEIRHEVSA